MMNNHFDTSNLTQQMQHVSTSPPQAPTAVLNTFISSQQQQQQQQHLAAAVAAGAIYNDPRQLQLNTNTIDKNYYTTAATTIGTIGSPQRFYASTGTNPPGLSSNSTTHQPNTILITNNFPHQQAGLSPENQRNIRIVTSTANHLNPANTSSLASTTSGFQQAQHVFNLNNKHLQHVFPQHILSQSTFQPTATELFQQQFATHPFPQQSQQNHSAASIQLPHFYVSSENSLTAPLNSNSNQKLITNLDATNATPGDGSVSSAPLVGSNPNNSTVVLDRINICINNLYTDTSSSSASNSLASTPAQQSSPIIPAIQHKPIVENGPPLAAAVVYESNILVIDEPDSTTTATTPHTPPTTPENPSPPLSNIGNSNTNSDISTTSCTNSPSTSFNYQKLLKTNPVITTKQSFASLAQNIEDVTQNMSDCNSNSTSLQLNQLAPSPQTTSDITTTTAASNTPLTPPTPPSPKVTNNQEYLNESKQASTLPLFTNGEDVFIKRHDDRFYLGTVINTAHNQFLVRFDDKTEVWCEAGEMRKLGISSTGHNTSTDKSVSQPMCVACKRSLPDSKVEICERCGRGYHLKCTIETSPGSDIWICKRCAKPMKLDESSKFSSGEEETETETFLQLHYNVESPTWDNKHQTNAEKFYCYCGMSGKIDSNMLQCWRCLNGYHTYCINKLRSNLLQGDCFFVFCCSVCNNGNEYLRRVQASWADMVHLVLYNLSVIKKHHKFHHLLKDINPYILEKRKMLPIPNEWISMEEKEFLEKVKSTLKENTHLFMCGKEIKRDTDSFALRFIEPPVIKRFPIKSHDIFNDDFVINNLKHLFLHEASENIDFKSTSSNIINAGSTSKSKRKLNENSHSHDVYQFDDTSEDEIPIRQILNKVKKTKLSPLPEITLDHEQKVSGCMNNISVVEDDNANDELINSLLKSETTLSSSKFKKDQTPTKDGNSINPLKSASGVVNRYREETLLTLSEKSRSTNTKQMEKSSRKRKAFTLSKNYNSSHLIDSSSDENSSSSSKGTSLDLIIPPPKNFLGQNNPFRLISPKKNISDINATTSSNKKAVSFGIFNTTALNFSSKLAALKSAGLFPKLSTSNLAKAAGQPRTVRTIKRRLSAKDITIGPNKEVRRRRTRRLSSNIEVISTTTINPIPTNFFPLQAKDLLAAAAASKTSAASLFTTKSKITSTTSSININNTVNTSASSYINIESINMDNVAAPTATSTLPTHGRRLRQRPQKNSPNTSRRSSVSSNQSSTSSASAAGCRSSSHTSNSPHHDDLKHSVNKYFGIVNRIESGEQFSIRAKRQLANGQMQYLIEWGEIQNVTPPLVVSVQNFSNQTTNSQLVEVSTIN